MTSGALPLQLILLFSYLMRCRLLSLDTMIQNRGHGLIRTHPWPYNLNYLVLTAYLKLRLFFVLSTDPEFRSTVSRKYQILMWGSMNIMAVLSYNDLVKTKRTLSNGNVVILFVFKHLIWKNCVSTLDCLRSFWNHRLSILYHYTLWEYLTEALSWLYLDPEDTV